MICLFLWGQSCYNPNDFQPPVVRIILPESGEILKDSLNVICIASDDNAIDYVEFWIDGESEEKDSVIPYSFILYARDYDDNSKHAITARAYDVEGDYADSEPVYFKVCISDQDTSVTQPMEKGHFIYLAASDNHLYRYHLGNNELELLVSEYRGRYPHYMESIHRIGFRSHGSYHISTMNPDGSDQKIIYDLPTLTCIHDYCDKNSTFYGYTIGNPNRIIAIDIEKNDYRLLTNPEGTEDYDGDINEKGNLLVFKRIENNQKKLVVLDIENNVLQNIQFQNENDKYLAKWSDLNFGFFFIEETQNSEYHLKFYDFNEGTENIIFSYDYNFGYSFSPDEKYIAMTMIKDNSRDLYIYDREKDLLNQKTSLEIELFHEEWVEIK
ncbi:MAG: hypothetical protein JXQ65_04770 [Candidatus Marinimicrobia bacterium]|nr:hypothetical protein [Candidatus Neomarinimicrobiota bacterium]